MTSNDPAPTQEDLLAMSAYSERFERDDFVAGEWAGLEDPQAGVTLGEWWVSSEVVEEWHQDLYDRHVIEPHSDYLSKETADKVRQLMASPQLVSQLDLATLRRVLTFLVRAERHAGGGWFEDAFKSGFAQAATKRLGEFTK